MTAGTISILEGSTFVVSDRAGDIDASPAEPHGLFHMDTRYLSRWRLRIDGAPLTVMSTDDLAYCAAQFFLAVGEADVYVNATISVMRRRAVGGGFHEDLELENHGADAVDLVVRVDAGADFADLFEVKDALAKQGEAYRRVDPDRLVLGYRRDRYVRETWVTCATPCELDDGGVTLRVRLPPRGVFRTALEVVVAWDGLERRTAAKYRRADEPTRPDVGRGPGYLLPNTPTLVSSWPQLDHTYRRCLVDLAALRFYSMLSPEAALPAAGLPWFMAVFGRDSVITSLQALPFDPSLARATLFVLGMYQGTKHDAFRDEEPGKILHEIRWGELTGFEERPHSPYFGAADATPLWLILLDEYERWTGDVALVRQLEQVARAAVGWIDTCGDRDGDGYIEYETRNPETGLIHQCWRDSPDAIRFADGRTAVHPIATCELQGYAYDARVRCARLARQVWGDPALADRLERDAAALKARFNRDFWCPERGHFALALDGAKRRVDALTSNLGHLLWSGIADADKAAACARHLMSERLFTGWGVRTMSDVDAAYNPIGYHLGTVWPHDTSIAAWGLRRYGYRADAAQLAFALLQAAPYFRGRLPEAFAGYPRARTHFPVEYPTACSPQAWATGAPLLMLRAILGLEPVGEQLVVDPAVPEAIRRLELLDIPGRWGVADAFGRGRVAVDGGHVTVAQTVL